MALMARAIVFDFDGVIVDTEPLHFAAFREVLPDFGITLSRGTYFSRYVGMSDEEILRRVLSDQDCHPVPEQIRQLLHNKDIAYRRRIETGIDLATGAEALIRLASRRWVPAICSGSKRVEIEHILRRADMLSLFSVIVTTEDVSVSKPDPAGYLLAIARQPIFVIAVSSGAIAYVMMSYVMTATPLSMNLLQGHSLESTKWVIQSQPNPEPP